jgi:hypothetical protein
LLSPQLAILVAIYVVPAAILFGGTIAIDRISRWKVVLPPKGPWNLMDPMVVAVPCWLAFMGRVAWGRKRRQSNRAAAYATIALSMAIAVTVELYMPPLPQ